MSTDTITFISKKKFYHAVTIAWIFACLLTIAKSGDHLNWLDVTSLRVALTWLDGGDINPDPVTERNVAERPLVITITDELYETEFAQASPLDRSKLAVFIRGTLGFDTLLGGQREMLSVMMGGQNQLFLTWICLLPLQKIGKLQIQARVSLRSFLKK